MTVVFFSLAFRLFFFLPAVAAAADASAVGVADYEMLAARRRRLPFHVFKNKEKGNYPS